MVGVLAHREVAVEGGGVDGGVQEGGPHQGRDVLEEDLLRLPPEHGPAACREADGEPHLDRALRRDDDGGALQHLLAGSGDGDLPAPPAPPAGRLDRVDGRGERPGQEIPERNLAGLRRETPGREARDVRLDPHPHPARGGEGVGLGVVDEEGEAVEGVGPLAVPVRLISPAVDPSQGLPEASGGLYRLAGHDRDVYERAGVIGFSGEGKIEVREMKRAGQCRLLSERHSGGINSASPPHKKSNLESLLYKNIHVVFRRCAPIQCLILQS